MANHKNLSATPAQFDQQFNKALRTGVEKGDFTQPKGTQPSSPLFSRVHIPCYRSLLPGSARLLSSTILITCAGSSGPVKLAKKEAAPKKTTSEPAAKVSHSRA